MATSNQTCRRAKYTQQQLAYLETEFRTCKFANGQRRIFIARNLGMTENQVKNWFQNRRTKNKENNGNKNNLEVMISPTNGNMHNLEAKKVIRSVPNMEYCPTKQVYHYENNAAILEFLHQQKINAILQIIQYLVDPRLLPLAPHSRNVYEISADLDDLMAIIHNDLHQNEMLQFYRMQKRSEFYSDNTLPKMSNQKVYQENTKYMKNIPNCEIVRQKRKLADVMQEEAESMADSEDLDDLLEYISNDLTYHTKYRKFQ